MFVRRLVIVCTVLMLTVFVPIQDAFASPENAKRFEDVLQHVYQTNPQLQGARAELERTRELYPQARAGWLPSAQAEASLYASDVESSNFGSGDGATTKEYTLSVDQPIFRGGRTFAETARAKDLIRAGEAILRQAEQAIYLSTVLAYMDVIRDRELYTLRQRNEEILNAELEGSNERFDLGEITKTDVQQVQARVWRAQANKMNAEAALEASEARFEEIVGYKPPHTLLVPREVYDIPKTLEEMITLAEAHNPDMQIAKYQHQAAEHDIDARLRELFPQLSAFASHNKQYDPQPGIVADSETQMVGLRASIALYQGGATRSRIREARSEAQKRSVAISEVRRRIRQEVTRNWKSYLVAKGEIRARYLETQAAKMALDGVREEAMIGQRMVLDILDADEDLIEAQASLARSSRDDLAAYYALLASLGLLDFQNALINYAGDIQDVPAQN